MVYECMVNADEFLKFLDANFREVRKLGKLSFVQQLVEMNGGEEPSFESDFIHNKFSFRRLGCGDSL